MDVSPQFSQGKSSPANDAPVSDPRLQPTPDYGTLGPGSDIGAAGPGANVDGARNTASRKLQVLAAAIGMFAALIAGAVSRGNPLLPRAGKSSYANEPKSSRDAQQRDGVNAQKQAEILLEQAVAHSPGAVDQISSQVNQWQGKMKWTPQIANLTTAALNSDDMRVRESGVEVELAAYGLSKNSQSLEYLLRTADSSDHAQKIWALWALGLMANRGVESAQVVEVLVKHLSDSDVESRHWAVEALALAGTDASLTPLLKTMHDDVSPLVRERAACSLAESGMFTRQQRFTAVPQLIDYTDDPALDAPTHAWAFHALSDITRQRLGNDAAAWREWYQRQVASGQ